MTRFEKALLLLFVLNTLDIILTLIGVCALGANEMGPLMRAAIGRSPIIFAVAKVAGMTWILYLLHVRYHHGSWSLLRWRRIEPSPGWAWANVAIYAAVFTAVCAWNTIVIAALAV